MGRILLVRHGQASLLEDDYDRLSLLGRVQAETVGRWLGARMLAPRIIATGTLKRQVDSATACTKAAGWDGVPSLVDAGFDEYGYHDLFAQAYPHLADPAVLSAHLRASEHPRLEFHSLFERAFDGWLRGSVQGRDGLTWPVFRERCLGALQRVAEDCGAGERAVVVTSGGPIAAVCQALLGVPDERVPMLHTPLFNGSITQLLTRGRDMALSFFNSVSHLEADPVQTGLLTHR
ncbi:MAG TPA: histidine phosphatase family protein [Burkholderiaceae bacterium]|nr:histidine phosphatase family protein [Burkholderiaceae bacterium]